MKIFSTLLLSIIFVHTIAQNTYDWSMSNSKWSYQVEGQIAGGGLYWPSPMKREVTFDQLTVIQNINGDFSYDQYIVTQFAINDGATECCPRVNQMLLKLHNDVLYYQLPYAVNNFMGYLEDDTIVNFNAEIGDAWCFHDPFLVDPGIGDTYFPYDNQTAGITSVLDTGSRIISGISLKWIYVEYQVTDANGVDDGLNYTDTIFERIGPKRNLIPSEYFYDMDSGQQGGANFACYSDDNFTEYVENSNICYAYVGIEEEIRNQVLEVYPNPTNGIVNLEFTGDNKDDSYYFVTDITGREITRLLISSEIQTYDFQIEQNGLYLIHLIFDGSNVGTKKVILSK